MNRQILNISNLEYICDLYEVGKYNPTVYKEYVIIRNLDFINNVAYDRDIYFLEKDIYEKIKNNNSELTDLAVFPCYNNKFGSFSRNYTDFANMLDKLSFKIESEGGNIFSLYKFNNGEYTNENVLIPCDKIKVYHPYSKSDLDYIIYLDNMINGIHFHYFCNYNSNCVINSETEFKHNNSIYSEYIEFYIPNLNSIFRQNDTEKDSNGNIIADNNIYINDYYNITKYIDELPYTSKKNSVWISSKEEDVKDMFSDVDMLSFVPLYLLLNPFVIIPNKDGTEQKIYYRLSFQECNNYNSFPINITIYPYEKSTINDILLMTSDYISNSDTYVKDNYFNLCSKLGFSHNQVCVVNTFIFNNKFDADTNPEGITTQEAYAKYNGLPIKKDINNEYYCPLYEGWVYTDEDNEFDDTDFIKCCGYQIDVATDFNFKNIIATDYQEMRFIDDFEFSLLNLFDDWYTIPDTIVIRIKFIDKFLGITLNTGNIILTKEWIKYIINHSDATRLINDFSNNQNDLKDNMSWNLVNAKESTFNFIDKINCIVNKTDTNITNINTNSTTNVKVIYKPIFYKTQTLQTINLTQGYKQKIGINLSQYMSKVSLFKLVINDLEISEYGRNDIYVIFEINASDLTNITGTYNIVDSDDNYISSGTYIVS